MFVKQYPLPIRQVLALWSRRMTAMSLQYIPVEVEEGRPVVAISEIEDGDEATQPLLQVGSPGQRVEKVRFFLFEGVKYQWKTASGVFEKVLQGMPPGSAQEISFVRGHMGMTGLASDGVRTMVDRFGKNVVPVPPLNFFQAIYLSLSATIATPFALMGALIPFVNGGQRIPGWFMLTMFAYAQVRAALHKLAAHAELGKLVEQPEEPTEGESCYFVDLFRFLSFMIED